MKHCILIAFIALLTLASCRTGKDVYSPPVVINNTDSIKTETIVITKLDTLTVYVEIPAQSAERHTMAGNSHLETDFATSDAWINDDGSLSHTLNNKPQSLPADVVVPTTISETNTENVSIREVPVYVPEPVEVERDFTWWERFRLKAFWYLLVISLAGVGWTFRKPLISAIRKFC